ncbi:type II toxin-antitoxin system Phd/YefM family antitoxin [Lipingzhangella sp. LS1_29]|uniref:Antitoxin n=1 Tax=Lipingzhangella rawalii TaxID=2055835 RepID=A0ABU2HA44_9ACTN|nr:type II toxin-antitoxin system Phd/YefM family antitoxin [Lipingzhangella rawalii]MDS1271710.1 type II toxin-antitoxin system Phd/YefM family antitoxin [Lipingzhangella rawalii]
MVTQVNVYEAKTSLSALLARVEAGEEIVIARNGRAVASLVPARKQTEPRTPGAWRGQVWISEDFDELDEQTLADWYGTSLEAGTDS